MSAVSCRLPDAIAERLQRLADRTGRSKTCYVREAICEHLYDLEDMYLAEQRLIESRAGRSESVPLEELTRRYGLEDGVWPCSGARIGEAGPAGGAAYSLLRGWPCLDAGGPASCRTDLEGSRLGKVWGYRVGDYRVIARVED